MHMCIYRVELKHVLARQLYSTTPARQLRELNIQNHHIHLIEVKYCEDTRPGAQREASQQQHNVNCANDVEINFKVLRPPSTQSFWVWVGLSILPTLDHFKRLGIDPQRSTKFA
eukprot:1145526-Pelagomonas_calceolata.AAC.1